jgi:hypothetical protein
LGRDSVQKGSKLNLFSLTFFLDDTQASEQAQVQHFSSTVKINIFLATEAVSHQSK